MAEKKSMSTLAAKAVARVKQQTGFSQTWGVSEHLAFIRYMVMDALADANNHPDVKSGKTKLADALNARLKQDFAQDVEIAYASNFQKLLVKSGELKGGSEYE